MIDLHSHLVPGVDDGSASVEESRAALTRMREQGVRALVTTPHVDGSLSLRSGALAAALEAIDAGWRELEALATGEFADLKIHRGAEVMLNAPDLDLSDPRLRLAGTSFALVEFPYMRVPPRSAEVIFHLKMRGVTPVIAHPERYEGVDGELEVIGEWRRVGGHLQVNCGSLLGRYGERAKATAWRLLGRGWVDYLASDYHARGGLHLAEARARLEEKGGAEVAELLLQVNPGRLLHGEPPEPVPPLQVRKPSFWRRLFAPVSARARRPT